MTTPKQLAFQPSGDGFIHVTGGVEDGVAVPVSGGGWNPATLLGAGGIFDFSALGSQVIAADGPVVLGGLTWTKRNSANEAPAPATHIQIVNAQGLQGKPGRTPGFAATDYGQILGGAQSSAPMLALAFPQFLPPTVGWPSSLEIAIDVFSEAQNAALATQAFTAIGIDNGIANTDGGQPFYAGFGAMGMTGTGVVNNRFFVAGTRRATGTQTDTIGAVQAVQTLVLTVDKLADDLMSTLVLFSAGASFPNDDLLSPDISTSVNTLHTWRGQAPASVDGLFLSLAFGTQTEGAAYTSIIKRVRARYRL